MVLLHNGLDDEQIENESEPGVATVKSHEEPVLQVRDTNASNNAKYKVVK